MVTRTVTWMGVLTCIACGGPNDETLVDELRVLSMVSNPPEVIPGETYVIQHLTHIPLGTGSERITWPCTFDGTGCAEAAPWRWSGTSLSHARCAGASRLEVHCSWSFRPQTYSTTRNTAKCGQGGYSVSKGRSTTLSSGLRPCEGTGVS